VEWTVLKRVCKVAKETEGSAAELKRLYFAAGLCRQEVKRTSRD
jgi:hypothetical protein